MTKTALYTVQAKLDLFVSIEVRAQSLADALEQSKTLKETDFVEIGGEFIDGSMEVTGVYK